jgi:SAM-dependent methyltransferase
MNIDLYQFDDSKKFYEARYENGYMDQWPSQKKERVYELIKSLGLPKNGLALDFGCGNGVFTDVLQKALPEWKIYGSEISQVALNQAKVRFPKCNFFLSGTDNETDLKFDFIFTHHVLEHVYDIEKTISDIEKYSKPLAYMLHILPCGNKNSFEYKVCNMRIDGVNKNMSNRYFYEDEGHLRRLSTSQANLLFQKWGYSPDKEFYSNQYFGALKWIIQEDFKFIKEFANPQKANGLKSFILLFLIKLKLSLLHRLYIIQKKEKHKKIKFIKVKNRFTYLYYYISYIFSLRMLNLIDRFAQNEWDKNKKNVNGSEMYLFYARI